MNIEKPANYVQTQLLLDPVGLCCIAVFYSPSKGD